MADYHFSMEVVEVDFLIGFQMYFLYWQGVVLNL